MDASQRKTKACDGCRFRKVKCHGSWPCTQCAHLNLSCTFSTPPTSRRGRGRRGWLVAQLRGERRGENGPECLPQAHNPQAGSRSEPPRPTDFFLGLLPQYAEFVYPLNPIISPQEMEEAIRNMDQSSEDAALVHAFAAITINRMRSSWALHKGVAVQMTELVRCSIRAHRAYELDWDDEKDDSILKPLPVTAKRILTCVFLSVCALTLGRVDRSFAWLREGITMFQALDFGQKFPGRPDNAARWQRLYWELFLHERHVALLPSFGSVLPAPSSGPPVSDPSIPGHINLGFRRLVNLFAILDDKFLAHWRSQHNDSLKQSTESPLTTQWIENKHRDLDEDAAGTAEEEKLSKDRGSSGLTELQHIDLVITRLWLRTLLWQLALSQGLLASTTSPTNHEGLSFQFPINSLYTEFRSVFSRLQDVTSVGFHGMGMLEKLFEITSTIADVMVVTSQSGQIEDEDVSRVEYLLFLFKFLAGFDAVASKQRNYLLEKLQAMKGMYTMINFGKAF
ncbi:unnamed protein product [Clonostachys rosea f. rosea IK726]|uniref:Uncharacterized protein n=1 Tax=Clonostachys rosea f. rosea IK726 TaxID=1349383 RepID=A0ACA9UQ85_BIOOC|nr:unnamed protein product [Clonostachys rosea f. rosea IK726]